MESERGADSRLAHVKKNVHLRISILETLFSRFQTGTAGNILPENRANSSRFSLYGFFLPFRGVLYASLEKCPSKWILAAHSGNFLLPFFPHPWPLTFGRVSTVSPFSPSSEQEPPPDAGEEKPLERPSG